MLKNYIAVLWIGVLLVITGVYAEDRVIFTDPAQPIVVEKSVPVFNVVLPSNPSTGFSWELKDYDANLILSVENKFYAPPSQCSPDGRCKVGVPGHEKWTFRVKPAWFAVSRAKSISSITLVYRRSWEKGAGAREVNFNVVTDNAD